VQKASKTYLTYPAIDINSSGQIGLTYMKSGTDTSTDYMSMLVTGRNTADAAGTMETPVVVPAGAGKANYNDTYRRAGDLSGINVDANGSFWAANEFATANAAYNWGTAVANFTISNPLPAADLAVTASGPSSVDVSAGSTTGTYTITVSGDSTIDAQGVTLSNLLPAGSTLQTFTPSSTNPDSFSISGSTASAATVGHGNVDTFTLVVSAPASLANGAAFNNTSTVSAQNPDPNTANNSFTVTGSVVNNNPNADLEVTISGPATATEGGTVTYQITVTNTGPAAASLTTLTDTLASILNFKSATVRQGTFTVSSGVVTFSLGTIAANGTVTASVTAQAIEDGSTSNAASVTSNSPDPNLTNNNASATTSFTEPSISVSGSITTRSLTVTNIRTATFTHASGVEPTSAFTATINWGDNTTSVGTITLSGITYSVSGSHTYTNTNRHTIRTTVVETGNGSVKEGGNKVDVNPGTLPLNQRDLVHVPDLAGDPDGWRFEIDALLGQGNPPTWLTTGTGGPVSEATLDALWASIEQQPHGNEILASLGHHSGQGQIDLGKLDLASVLDDLFFNPTLGES
jgi:uncharacterized repeat protein (TIGR01451 family)